MLPRSPGSVCGSSVLVITRFPPPFMNAFMDFPVHRDPQNVYPHRRRGFPVLHAPIRMQFESHCHCTCFYSASLSLYELLTFWKIQLINKKATIGILCSSRVRDCHLIYIFIGPSQQDPNRVRPLSINAIKMFESTEQMKNL